jgi:hypothetical protein
MEALGTGKHGAKEEAQGQIEQEGEQQTSRGIKGDAQEKRAHRT